MGENIWIFGIALTTGAIITLLGVVVGSWIMFRGKSSQPNEKFLGGQAKGEVFSVPDVDDLAEFPGEPSKDEEHLLEKTEAFLKTLSGGK
jgi:hypothetical protein